MRPQQAGGVQLVAGWNNVAYTGPSQSTQAAVASIASYLIIVWVYRGSEWYWYDPLDPAGNTLTYLYNGEAVWIDVTQSCYWSWGGAAQTPKASVISAAVPSSASAGSRVTITATVKNIGPVAGWISIGVSSNPSLSTYGLTFDTGWLWLEPNASADFALSFDMPSVNVTELYVLGVSWDGSSTVTDTQLGPYTITVTAAGPQIQIVSVNARVKR